MNCIRLEWNTYYKSSLTRIDDGIFGGCTNNRAIAIFPSRIVRDRVVDIEMRIDGWICATNQLGAEKAVATTYIYRKQDSEYPVSHSDLVQSEMEDTNSDLDKLLVDYKIVN
jgi:hypothetical protein